MSQQKSSPQPVESVEMTSHPVGDQQAAAAAEESYTMSSSQSSSCSETEDEEISVMMRGSKVRATAAGSTQQRSESQAR